ncbi:MAG: hypothetical protein KF791_15840 [Verrucomicrobiae bacterium]|nr:hypothetical protein [Verrucomicrobiae bacterium]
MQLMPAVLLVLIPGLPLLSGLALRAGPPAWAGPGAVASAAAALLLALLATAEVMLGGGGQWRLAAGAASPAALTLRLDAVSATLAVLVSFLGLVVSRFSRNYLAGDPGQGRFFSWMSLTLAAVLLLVLSGNLLVLLAAWVATSLLLHQLLTYYPERKGAVFSARKKFVYSRLGDGCLLAALVLVQRHFGTWEMEAIFARLESGAGSGLTPIGLLLAGCALLKSAQFPFHGWLPDTMETPTPVSAFMHAGIINAGGFLVIRLSPLMVEAGPALALLALAGALSAVFGAMVMLTQPTVKRALAFSTVAQMGFMLLQCGLGAFGLALVHLVAHSLYKAHAFLRAGSTVGAVPRAAIPLPNGALIFGAVAGAALVLGMAAVRTALLPGAVHPAGVFTLILALALAYGVARVASAPAGSGSVAGALGIAAGVAAVGLGLHAAAGWIYASLPVVAPPGWVLAVVGAVFVALFLFQILLWRAGGTHLGRVLYVHALNGFYMGTWGNRLLNVLWPADPVAVPRPAPHLSGGIVASQR